MTVLVPIAPEQAPTLANLYELYAHDFSEFVPLRIKPSGRFDVAAGDLWWRSEAHHPFFICRGDELCGFALARRGSQLTGAREVMDVAEFFVLRGVRRTQVGLSAARALFQTFHGPWEVRVRQANLPALKFWARVAETQVGHALAPRAFTRDAVDYWLFAFES